jgi:hypothetical protein
MPLPRKRQRARAPDIDIYIPEDLPPPGTPPPRVIVQRHTAYDSTSETLSVSRSYYTMPKSPQKATTEDINTFETTEMTDMPIMTYDDSGVIMEDDINDRATLPSDWMDPNYMDDPTKRDRTEATVCIIASIRCDLLTWIQDNPLRTWTREIDLYIQEILRLEGLGDSSNICCSRCSTSSMTLYRCLNCLDSTLSCSSCMVVSHSCLPFHKVQVSRFSIHRMHNNLM